MYGRWPGILPCLQKMGWSLWEWYLLLSLCGLGLLTLPSPMLPLAWWATEAHYWILPVYHFLPAWQKSILPLPSACLCLFGVWNQTALSPAALLMLQCATPLVTAEGEVVCFRLSGDAGIRALSCQCHALISPHHSWSLMLPDWLFLL